MTESSPFRTADPSREASCLLCGTPGLAGSTCPSCRLPLPWLEDGERPLRDMTCPRCRVPLVSTAPDATSVVHVCRSCHGMFVPPRAWHVLLTTPERVVELEAKLPAGPRERPALIDSVTCLACEKEMDRHRFAAISDVVIDRCLDRHGVWLDAGEAAAIVRFMKVRAEVGESALQREAEAAALKERIASDALVLAAMRRALAGEAPSPGVVTGQSEGTRTDLRVLLLLVLLAAVAGAMLAKHCGTAQASHSETRL
ncbi:MAG: hypothetical protein JWP87_1671 [Labilithrix sp.]|nr:hypothetical protein [Labilithrix sp.]